MYGTEVSFYLKYLTNDSPNTVIESLISVSVVYIFQSVKEAKVIFNCVNNFFSGQSKVVLLKQKCLGIREWRT